MLVVCVSASPRDLFEPCNAEDTRHLSVLRTSALTIGPASRIGSECSADLAAGDLAPVFDVPA